ncbi:MAG: ornithine cyclodeaminase family protein [Alphaproteobacteria bacterium]|nr:ornithine cyclodeaminase family protein [Alphaproteobacteria bacterium]
METLILTRSDVAALMPPPDYLDAVEAEFRALAEGRACAPPPMTIPGAGGTFHAKGAAIAGEGHFVAFKLNGNFPPNPEARGMPTIQGAILLCDGATGTPLAIMDSAEVTLRRTAAATTLAARYLARPESESLLVCGCGAQAEAQIEALAEILALRTIFLWDLQRERAQALAGRLAGRFDTVAVSDPAAAARECDVIVTCTTACAPFVRRDWLRPGTFVAAVGADSPDKSEIDPDAMGGAKVVADVAAQCAAIGDLRHAIAAGTMQLRDVHAELHELVAGTKPGRTDEREITLFDSTRTALQDVASAVTILRRARAAGRGRPLDLAA